MSSPGIWTYHCICSHLILATTRDIFTLPRRRPPALDEAIIVPLPPPPRATESESEDSDDDEEEDSDVERMEIDNRPAASSTTVENKPADTPAATNKEEEEDEEEKEEKDYTLLLSSLRDRKPCIIRREDGFEKRLLWRCGRCRLIFGYQIDDENLKLLEKEVTAATKQSQDPSDFGNDGGDDGDEDGKGNQKDKKVKRKDRVKRGYVYILPGGLTTADGMGGLEEKDVSFVKDD